MLSGKNQTVARGGRSGASPCGAGRRRRRRAGPPRPAPARRAGSRSAARRGRSRRAATGSDCRRSSTRAVKRSISAGREPAAASARVGTGMGKAGVAIRTTSPNKAASRAPMLRRASPIRAYSTAGRSRADMDDGAERGTIIAAARGKSLRAPAPPPPRRRGPSRRRAPSVGHIEARVSVRRRRPAPPGPRRRRRRSRHPPPRGTSRGRHRSSRLRGRGRALRHNRRSDRRRAVGSLRIRAGDDTEQKRASSALRAIGPTWSSEGASGKMP
jgi:hypothetical protein